MSEREKSAKGPKETIESTTRNRKEVIHDGLQGKEKEEGQEAPIGANGANDSASLDELASVRSMAHSLDMIRAGESAREAERDGSLGEESIEIGACQIRAFCDPANDRTRLAKRQARQAIVVIAQDYLSRVFVLDAWAGNVPASVLITRLLATARKYRARTFGVEANAMQSLFANLLIRAAKDEAIERGEPTMRLPFVGVNVPTKIDKDFRIRTILEPVIAQGRLFIAANQTELEAELRGFPTARTKDLVDALASAIELLPARRVYETKNEGNKALERYLRATGASEAYIAKRLAGRDRVDRDRARNDRLTAQHGPTMRDYAALRALDKSGSAW